MPNIYLHNISTSYCLNKVNLKIEEGEFIVILGSTGAGKSTLLNVIAGLTEYDGEVYFNGKNMNDVPTERRDLGYLIQDIYLFPHMDVYKNIAFPLRAASCSADKTAEKVEAILELFNISYLKNRYPKELSGGEKRRVGLARCLIMEPKILLLDEPMASLDPVTAKALRKELQSLHRRLNLTTILVTHDFAEARELADRIGVILNGELKQLGTEQDIFYKPVREIQKFIV